MSPETGLRARGGAVRRALAALVGRARWHSHQIEDVLLERRLGIRSRGALEPTALTVKTGNPRDGFTYVPTPAVLLRWILGIAQVDRHEFTFIDLGSGKGRAVIAAIRAGYRRAVGVEFASELDSIARENMVRANADTGKVELVLIDASRYRFPDEPLVVYFNNPFNEQVMASVLTNLSESYVKHPRPIVAIYQQMRHEEPGHSTGNRELLTALPFLTRTDPRPGGLYSKFALTPFDVSVFTSPEARNRAVRKT